MDILTLLVRDLSAYSAFVLVAFLGLCAIAVGVRSTTSRLQRAELFRHQEKMAELQRQWRDAKLIEQQPQSLQERNRNNG